MWTADVATPARWHHRFSAFSCVMRGAIMAAPSTVNVSHGTATTIRKVTACESQVLCATFVFA
jgi:hypothetical protein